LRRYSITNFQFHHRDHPPEVSTGLPLLVERRSSTAKQHAVGVMCRHYSPSLDAPLRGLFAHMKGGYHDGRFPTLLDVVNDYNEFKKLNLSEPEKKDLVEFLKSL
jgi:hypothetical protein